MEQIGTCEGGGGGRGNGQNACSGLVVWLRVQSAPCYSAIKRHSPTHTGVMEKVHLRTTVCENK